MTALEAELEVAPDYAEAIAGWRVWHVAPDRDGFRLTSVIKTTLWPAGEALLAACLRPPSLLRWRRTQHAAPELRCQCGIYATGLDQLGRYLMEAPVGAAVARVFGEVSLWGTVVECERGFRASHAYPLRIVVPRDVGGRGAPAPEELARGLERYGVPVELMALRCVDAVRVLRRRQLRRAAG